MKDKRADAKKIKELLVEGKTKQEICAELKVTNGAVNRAARVIYSCEWSLEGVLIDYSCVHEDPFLHIRKLAEFQRDFEKRKRQAMLKELRDPYY